MAGQNHQRSRNETRAALTGPSDVEPQNVMRQMFDLAQYARGKSAHW